jgi:hypothetical protein
MPTWLKKELIFHTPLPNRFALLEVFYQIGFLQDFEIHGILGTLHIYA